MSDVIIIYDEYGTAWKLYPEDALYQEAKVAVSHPNVSKVIWPLEKIVEQRGFGWWTTFKKLDETETDLEKLVPNPGKLRLIDIDKEYTPTELRDLLQRFSSYLATLHPIEAKIEAQCHALKQSYATGMSVAIHKLDKTGTNKDREAEVLANTRLFKDTRQMQINNEATLMLVQGWRKAYESAYTGVSRLITLTLGELEVTSGRFT